MSYRLENDETPTEGVRRIAREQSGKALREVGKLSTPDSASAVHATRKHLKKMRALLRLICANLGEEVFEEENRRLRDLARSLSDARDAQVQLNVLEKLREQTGQNKTVFRKTAAALRREVATLSTRLEAPEVSAQTTLQWFSDRLEGWPLDGLSAENLGCALHRFYRRGRKEFHHAGKHPTAEHFHTWRKRVKDLCYQALLLQNLKPSVLCEMAATAKTLGQHLGELHDLSFFRVHLETRQNLPESERTLLLGLICARAGELQEIALDLGARFFAEKPKTLEKRLLRYAKDWARFAVPA